MLGYLDFARSCLDPLLRARPCSGNFETVISHLFWAAGKQKITDLVIWLTLSIKHALSLESCAEMKHWIH